MFLAHHHSYAVKQKRHCQGRYWALHTSEDVGLTFKNNAFNIVHINILSAEQELQTRAMDAKMGQKFGEQSSSLFLVHLEWMKSPK